MSRTLHLSYEAPPYSKYGGLGDVVESLPPELMSFGVRSTIVAPFHENHMRNTDELKFCLRLDVSILGMLVPADVLRTSRAGVDYYFIRCPRYFSRWGIYHERSGEAFVDHVERAVFFGLATRALIQKVSLRFDCVVTHDWYGSFLFVDRPSELSECRYVYVVHNFHYHGYLSDAEHERLTESCLPGMIQHLRDGLYRSLGTLAIRSSDWVVVASDGYRRELLDETAAGHRGMNVFSRLNPDRLVAIRSSISDKSLPWRSNGTLVASLEEIVSAKRKERDAVYHRFGLSNCEKPLLLLMSRLCREKGIYRIIDGGDSPGESTSAHLDRLLSEFNMIIAGTPTGDSDEISASLATLERRHQGSLAVITPYSDQLAPSLYRAADVFLFPSLAEPCGISQMYAMGNGAVPVVNAVGGLKDTVCGASAIKQGKDGYHFEATTSSMYQVLGAVIVDLRDQSKWQSILRNAVGRDFSWRETARQYASILSNGEWR